MDNGQWVQAVKMVHGRTVNVSILLVLISVRAVNRGARRIAAKHMIRQPALSHLSSYPNLKISHI